MSGSPFRILLVEDNQADAWLLRKALEDAIAEFSLQVIQDGAEALAFARGEGRHAARLVPDLIVLDVNLPKKDGTEVLAELRQCDGFANVPVVVTSSSHSPADRSKMEQSGVDVYLMKPHNLEDFLRIGLVLKQVLVKNQLHG